MLRDLLFTDHLPVGAAWFELQMVSFKKAQIRFSQQKPQDSTFHQVFSSSFQIFTHFSLVAISFRSTHMKFWVGLDSSVGIAIRHGLDGPGIEFR